MVSTVAPCYRCRGETRARMWVLETLSIGKGGGGADVFRKEMERFAEQVFALLQ